jgi:serine/threonine protein kinase
MSLNYNIRDIKKTSCRIVYNNLDCIISNHYIFKKYRILNRLKINKRRSTYHVIGPSDKDNKDKKEYVLKFIMKDDVSQDLLNIYKFLIDNKNNNIINIVKIINDNDDDFIIIMMEYIDGDNMMDYYLKHTNISKNRRNRILIDLVCGMNFLHQNNILHGDIKPENIMIDIKGNPIIVDFDLSKKCLKDSFYEIKRRFGTKMFIPPEINDNNFFCQESDIWSFGVSMFVVNIYYIFNKTYYLKKYGKKLLTSQEDIHDLMNKNRKMIRNKIGKTLFDIIKLTINDDLLVRPSSSKLFSILKKSKYYTN